MLAAPAGTPLNVIALPDIEKALLELGTEAYAHSPDEVQTILATAIVMWGGVIKWAGILPQ